MEFGAVILIILLNKYKNNIFKLFIYGELLGAFVEYFLSFILEAIYGIRFWDYSYLQYNLNGRICVQYSIYWGFLAVALLKLIKPIIDKVIFKIKCKYIKIINICIFIFLCIDSIITVWAITTFENRVQNSYYNIIKNTSNFNIFQKVKYNIEEAVFSNNIMINIFPNLRVILNDGKEVFIKDIIKSN